MSAATPLVLALETATHSPSVALWQGGSCLAAARHDGRGEHAEVVLPLVDEALRRAAVALDDVAVFAVSIGPGSFTSLRIGVASVKGLAFGRDVKVAAVSTLAAIVASAESAALADDPRWCVPLLDARMEEAYAAAYAPAIAGTSTAWREVLPAGIYRPEQLACQLPGEVRWVGEGAPLFEEPLRRAGAMGIAEAPSEAPLAIAVAQLGLQRWQRGLAVPAGDLVPHYARRAQAEVLRTGQRFEAAETSFGAATSFDTPRNLT